MAIIDPNKATPPFIVACLLVVVAFFWHHMPAPKSAPRVADLTRMAFDARFRLGLMLRDRGDLVGSAAAYRQAIVFDPRNATAHLELGIVLQQAGYPEAAADSYRASLQVDPGSFYAQALLAPLVPADPEEDLRETARADARLKALKVEDAARAKARAAALKYKEAIVATKEGPTSAGGGHVKF